MSRDKRFDDFREFLRGTLAKALHGQGKVQLRGFKLPEGCDSLGFSAAAEIMAKQSPAFVLAVSAYCPEDMDLTKFIPPVALAVAAATAVILTNGAEALQVEARKAIEGSEEYDIGLKELLITAEKLLINVAQYEAQRAESENRDKPPMNPDEIPDFFTEEE